ncbi:hypothetical protein TERTU_1775 [Teredinibacter turnerae T7901]|uniref:DUF3592 domain-containing protein n=1 Tax=Teredinibacter turnerae (strain ATCC 39867 / T7901) TaxID=377629 RepID=C5BUA6_TERTT|nr:hypothetical protein [Teredinibacter turnerae]ACR10689.1 hypothetical protein TERTU_1775 [Teredinibacter turnerae T7901]
MKKIWNWFIYLFILAGFPLLAWAGYYLVADTYNFWKNGIEKQALVIELDRTSSSGKGGTTYYYKLEIDSLQLVEGFRVRLPIGKYVSVLTLPNDPGKVTPGTESSGLYEIYKYEMGSDLMVVLSLGMFVFMAIYGPSTFVTLLKSRDKIINQ